MTAFRPGEVISFSAGTGQVSPDGYRVLRERSNVLAACAERWPHVLAVLAGRLPFLINAYPAPTGPFPFGLALHTYLSVRTAVRGLQLAVREDLAPIVVGQPLLLAEILIRYDEGGFPWPPNMLLATGGYPTPMSLEQLLRRLASSHGTNLEVLHLYGVAEVDAGCLLAVERTPAGELIYYPRGPDVGLEIAGEELLLSIRDDVPDRGVDRFRTGDLARCEGDGFVIWNPQRLSPEVAALLESWTEIDWRRRTGYLLRKEDGRSICQLRASVEPVDATEREYHEFARLAGVSWLVKPRWA